MNTVFQEEGWFSWINMRGALLISFRARKSLHLSLLIHKYRYSHKVTKSDILLAVWCFWRQPHCINQNQLRFNYKISIDQTLKGSNFRKLSHSGRIEKELYLWEEEKNSGMTSRLTRHWKKRWTVKDRDMEKSDLESIITLLWSLMSDWKGANENLPL